MLATHTRGPFAINYVPTYIHVSTGSYYGSSYLLQYEQIIGLQRELHTHLLLSEHLQSPL